MSTKHKGLAYIAAALLAAIFLGRYLLAPPQTVAVNRPETVPAPTMPTAPSAMATGPATITGAGQPELVDYAISVSELSGLSVDVVPGTALDLWVTWDPPVTERPQVQRLLRGVMLQRLIPPVTPDGPSVALLSVRERSVARLIYGDRYGSLTATTSALGAELP